MEFEVLYEKECDPTVITAESFSVNECGFLFFYCDGQVVSIFKQWIYVTETFLED